jgi:outer membrane lipoprotein carrier protein
MSDMPGGYAIMFCVNAMTAIILAALLAAPETDARLAESLVRRLEERQARAQDLTARFVQSYRSGILGREVIERGVVRIKRPGRMLWEYKDPEKKTFLSDGRSYYFYVPADRQVIVREQDEDHGVAALLLSGKGRILEQFEARLDTAPAEGVFRLRLSPRKADPEIELVLVDVEPSGVVRAIQVDDAQGNRSRFRFDDVRENTGLPDRLFRFEVPAGVEVIRG